MCNDSEDNRASKKMTLAVMTVKIMNENNCDDNSDKS